MKLNLVLRAKRKEDKKWITSEQVGLPEFIYGLQDGELYCPQILTGIRHGKKEYINFKEGLTRIRRII